MQKPRREKGDAPSCAGLLVLGRGGGDGRRLWVDGWGGGEGGLVGVMGVSKVGSGHHRRPC